MAEFFDYDPFTGMRYDTEYDHETGKITVHSSQDVTPHIEHATRVRNSGVADKGIKRDVWKYATIPNHVHLKLLEKGINMYKKDHQKAFLREINTNYPHLKYTRLKHE